MKKVFIISFLVFAVFYCFSFNVKGSCKEGFFGDIKGPEKIELHQIYNYNVEITGFFKEVHWSISGGDLIKEWSERNLYFCKVKWTQNDRDYQAKVKVWGIDGCGRTKDSRLYVKNIESNEYSSRIPDEVGMIIKPPVARKIVEKLEYYWQSSIDMGIFISSRARGQLIHNLDGAKPNQEAVDICWNYGIKPSIEISLDRIVNDCLDFRDDFKIEKCLRRKAFDFLQSVYLFKKINKNTFSRWVELISSGRDINSREVRGLTNKLINEASDLTTTHLKKAKIIPDYIRIRGE